MVGHTIYIACAGLDLTLALPSSINIPQNNFKDTCTNFFYGNPKLSAQNICNYIIFIICMSFARVDLTCTDCPLILPPTHLTSVTELLLN